MKALRKCISLVCLALLASCGGGGGDPGDGAAVSTPGTQQQPQGIWEGTTGSGAGERAVFGYIDGGSDGKGGDFYLARAATATSAYDGLYGVLRVNQQTAQASGVTYFSARDGRFAEGLTLTGSLGSSAAGGAADAISGSYSNPAGTAAATGGSTVFKLARSPLNGFPAQAARIAGSYSGGTVFGGGWVLHVDAAGSVTGTVSGCTITGTIVPYGAATSSAYAATLNLSGSQLACAATGTTQAGVAVVKYDTAGQRTGIWVLTRNVGGTASTFALEGGVLPSTVNPPATSQQSAAGFWKSATGSGQNDLSAVVLPDNSYFFYKRSSTGYDALHGTLKVAQDTSVVSSTDGVYFAHKNAAASQYTTGVALTGDVRTGTSFAGSYTDPAAANMQTAFNLVPDASNPYASALAPTTERLYGTYTSAAAGFGGATTVLTVRADTDDAAKSVIAGTTTDGCTVNASIAPYSGAGTLNLFRVETLVFSGSGCQNAGEPYQSGIANAVFDAAGANVTGLRILAAGYNNASGVRANFVFVGSR